MTSRNEQILASLCLTREQIGPFHLDRINDLLGVEMALTEEQEKALAGALASASELVCQYAATSGKPLQDAHNEIFTALLNPAVMKQPPPEMLPLLPSLFTLVGQFPSQIRNRHQMVTLLLNHRGWVQGEDGAMEKIEGWTDEDTGKLPRDILEQIIAFRDREANHGEAPKPITPAAAGGNGRGRGGAAVAKGKPRRGRGIPEAAGGDRQPAGD